MSTIASAIAIFNPSLLKSGDKSQLHKWVSGRGNSIYIKWIPDQMDEAGAYHYFNYIGSISRVDIAPHTDGGRGRMMFIHFNEWYPTAIPSMIADAYPESYPIGVRFASFEDPNIFKKYTLNCFINTRPIPAVDYNSHQLSDMIRTVDNEASAKFHALEAKVAELQCQMADLFLEFKRQKDANDELTYENQYLLSEIQYMQSLHPEDEDEYEQRELEEFDVKGWNNIVKKLDMGDSHLL